MDTEKIEIQVYLAGNDGIGSLQAWLQDVPGVLVEPVAGVSRTGEQGDAWDFLSVLCGTGGAVTVAVNALATWIESKVTHARVVVGQTEMELRGPDPEALTRLVQAAGEIEARGGHERD
ncbi:effector-associated constant component EACC1 [Amycolatopsis sp. lyj-108]|uniref:effector-associated constant component EACC1 n=1 Tax=Amycolatopsis sp. lyj-108 TaxID=2789286 RepID=UPI00397D7FB4